MPRLVNARTGVVVSVSDDMAEQLGAEWQSPDAEPEADADDAPDETQDAGEVPDAEPVKRGRSSKSE